MSRHLAVHILGASDLGVQSIDFEGTFARFRDLSPTQQADQLLSTRTEGNQAVMPPLQALLVEADPTPSEILLLGTDQQPRHPGDTAELGDLICETIARDPDVFGVTVRATVQRVADVSISAFRSAVKLAVEAADKDGSPFDRVVVGLGPGSVASFIGTVLGLVESGHAPIIYPTNQQDVGRAPVVDLASLPSVDVSRWLLRHGQFEALADCDADNEAAWKFLASMSTLNWPRMRQLLASDQRLRERLNRHPDLIPPRPPGGNTSLPARDSAWFCDVLGSQVRWRLQARDDTGAHLARNWISTELRRRHRKLDAVDQTAALIGFAEASDDWAVEVMRKLGAGELPALPPGLAEFAEHRAVGQIWRPSAAVSHGRSPDLEWVAWYFQELARVFDLPDSIGNGLGLAGCAPWSPLGPDAMLVVKAVGLRDLDADGATPMLTAVMDDLRSRKGRPKVESAHFVFVATAEVKVQADALVAEAATPSWSTSCSIVEVPVADVAGTVLAVREHLRALPYLDEITEVSVASAQSTKAVNLGMLLGTAEVAAESAIRLELIEVAHEPPVGSVVRHDQDRVAARLMHDDAVRQLATAALHRRNLRLASRALAEGSVRWDELRLRIDALQDLSIGVVEPWGAGNLLHTQLHFVERSSIDDPWLVVRRVCALCEAQVELATIKLARRRDHGVEGGISWLWKQRNEVGHQAKFEPPAERHLVAALAAVKDAFAPSGSVTATPPWRSPIGTIWGAEIDIGPTFLDDQCRAMIDSLDEA